MARLTIVLPVLSVLLAWSLLIDGRGAAAQPGIAPWSACNDRSRCAALEGPAGGGPRPAFHLAAGEGQDTPSAEDGQESEDGEGGSSTAGYWAVGLVFLALAIGFVGVGIWMSRRPPG